MCKDFSFTCDGGSMLALANIAACELGRKASPRRDTQAVIAFWPIDTVKRELYSGLFKGAFSTGGCNMRIPEEEISQESGNYFNRLFQSERGWMIKVGGTGVVGFVLAGKLVTDQDRSLHLQKTVAVLIAAPIAAMLAALALIRADKVRRRMRSGEQVGLFSRLLFGCRNLVVPDLGSYPLNHGVSRNRRDRSHDFRATSSLMRSASAITCTGTQVSNTANNA